MASDLTVDDLSNTVWSKVQYELANGADSEMIKNEVCNVADANFNASAAEEMAQDWLYT